MWPQEIQDFPRFGRTTMCAILHEYKATLQPDRDSSVREWMRLKEAGKHLAAFSGPNSKYKQSCCYFNISEVVKLSLTLPWSNALQVQILYQRRLL